MNATDARPHARREKRGMGKATWGERPRIDHTDRRIFLSCTRPASMVKARESRRRAVQERATERDLTGARARERIGLHLGDVRVVLADLVLREGHERRTRPAFAPKPNPAIDTRLVPAPSVGWPGMCTPSSWAHVDPSCAHRCPRSRSPRSRASPFRGEPRMWQSATVRCSSTGRNASEGHDRTHGRDGTSSCRQRPTSPVFGDHATPAATDLAGIPGPRLAPRDRPRGYPGTSPCRARPTSRALGDRGRPVPSPRASRLDAQEAWE